MYCLVLLALVASVSANSCPSVSPVENFNFGSFAQGTWYEVARYPNAAEDGRDCGSAEYTRKGSVVSVKYDFVMDHQPITERGTVKPANKNNTLGVVTQTLPLGAYGAFADYDLNILAIEYDKYFIGYYCKYNESSKTHQEYAWVFSRSKALPTYEKVEVIKFIQKSPVLDEELFQWPKFTAEACRTLDLVPSVSADPCPSVSPVENFNFASFAQGTWYEVARYPNAAENGRDCGSAEYTRKGSVVSVKYDFVMDHQPITERGTVKPANKNNKLGVVTQILPLGAYGTFADYDLNILAIEYDKYFIGYYCQYDESSKTRQEYAWVFSRSKALHTYEKGEVTKFIQKSPVLDENLFQWIKFTAEACRIEA